MRKSFLFALFLLPIFAIAQVTTRTVPITHIYVPNGFDDNDNTEIIITGYLPNLCYKAPASQFKIDRNRIMVTVTSIYTPDDMCADMIVPFTETVRLGALKAQNYDIIVNANSMQKLMAKVVVKNAFLPSVDDYNYAYVTSIRHTKGSRKILIDGYNVGDCFALKEIKFESNGIDTYAVLPVLKRIKEVCSRSMKPVIYEAMLPNQLHRKEILLHVRAMQGNSVNTIYYGM